MDKYKVVGNENYQIDSKWNITRVDGNPSEYSNNDKEITISLYGIIYKVEREWLYWLSYFKLDLPKKVYPNRKISVEYFNNNLQGIEAKNVKTGEVVRANSEKLLSMEIPLPKSTINKLCLSNGTIVYNDYVVRRVSKEKWPPYAERDNSNTNKKILVTDIIDNTSKVCNSLRSTSTYLNINRNVITPLIKNKKIYKRRYKLELLEN